MTTETTAKAVAAGGAPTATVAPPPPARVVKRKPYSVVRTHDIIVEAAKKLPAKAQPWVQVLAWIIAIMGLAFSLVAPICNIIIAILSRIYKLIKPFHPENLLEALAGLFTCFFGGNFFLIVASAEAWRAASWEENKSDLKVIWEDAVKVHDANKKDAEVDADGNGIADIDEMDAPKLFLHKVHVALTSVNPETLSGAMGNLYMAFVAIVAALQVRFARIVTLGNALGDMVAPPVKRLFGPVFAFCLPKDYKKWAAPVIGFAIKFAAVQAAWMLQRVLATVHSAMRGGLMFSRGSMAYLRAEGYIKKEDSETYIDEVIGGLLALAGFFFQTQVAWTLPFPANIILLPFTLLETFLHVYVANAFN